MVDGEEGAVLLEADAVGASAGRVFRRRREAADLSPPAVACVRASKVESSAKDRASELAIKRRTNVLQATLVR
jgi:hypothetical protein